MSVGSSRGAWRGAATLASATRVAGSEPKLPPRRDPLEMLHIHRAERADGLVDALRALLSEPGPDPFSSEVVAVPTRGMERWLAQRMSDRLGAGHGRGDGVCANVDFPSPRRLVGDAVATASGIEADADPWLPERAVWALLEVVDGCLGEPWLASLAAHLGGSGDDVDPARRARRFSAVRHLAELFDRYALHRPEMVRAWARGEDAGVPVEGVWQAELWRRLRERIRVPDPAERVEGACERLREEPGIVDLPARISLFGLTRLPAGHLNVLRALAVGRDVHVFMLHPSPALWERVAERGVSVVRRREDPTAALPANRLLASWGQDSREMQLVLGASDFIDHHHAVDHGTGTLLAHLQADVRADRWPAGAPLPNEDDARPTLDASDRSVQVHACHGRARQVEVLRDAILHLLDEDATLEPRDVIVMCPDIETFAPLIQATFGAGEVFEDDDELEALPADVRPPDLRVRLADRALRQTNPVLGVVGRLLDLVDERLTASQVLDFADQEPVRQRFGLDDDDLARIEDWVAASGIRWGLDAAHRKPFKLEALAAGTWRSGVDRLLVGVTMTEEEQRLFHDVLPLDDVDSGAIDVAGRFAELVDRLQTTVDALNSPKTIDAWATAIAGAADALTTTSERDAWQRAELDRILGDVADEAAGTGSATSLVPAEIRALLSERLKGRPTRANFRTGHLTICTLMPMRSVPHRVVCLLGHGRRCLPPQIPPRRRRPHARRPPRRRPRRPHRGPPASPRRAPRRHRPAHRHLHRQRRAHEPRPSAGGADRRAAGRRRPHGADRRRPGEGAGRGATPPPALRPQELHRRRAHARARLELRPRHAPRRRSAHRRTGTDGAIPQPGRCRRGSKRSSSSKTSCASPATPSAPSCASGSASASGTTPTSSTTRCRSSSTRWSAGASGSGCSTGCSAARTSRRASRPRSRAGRCPRGSSRRLSSTASARSSRTSRPRRGRSWRGAGRRRQGGSRRPWTSRSHSKTAAR